MAFCGLMLGAIVGWPCMNEGTLLTASVARLDVLLDANMFIWVLPKRLPEIVGLGG